MKFNYKINSRSFWKNFQLNSDFPTFLNNSVGLVSPCAQHKCKVHVSLACLKSSWMDLNSLSCGGQCSPSHLYGTMSPCVSSGVILLLILLISSRFIGAPHSTRGIIPRPILSISTPAGLTFPPSSVRRADLPIMIGSSLPVAPLLSNPPARSILSTQTSNHPSDVLVPPYSGCRAAVCSSSLH